MDDRAALDEAIAALQAQRAMLGDAVVDTALGPLLERRAALRAAGEFEQRKLVTVLFSDLVDFTVLSQRLDPEDVRTIVNRYFRRWSEHIEAHGGVVEKFIGDAVMAVFGLYRSEEDDPHRAVRAAVAMIASLAELNGELQREHDVALNMRVGIDTGDVVVSTLDDRPGADFVVVGETVNRAARLQGAAPPGGVLLSPDTFRHVRGSFALQRIEGLQLKGIAAPIDAYLVLAEGSRSFWPETRGVEGVATRTVGRERELGRLQDAFGDVVDERSWRVVTVTGDAGVGKSRLVYEFDSWIAGLPEGVWLLRGRASSATLNVPNGLLHDVFAHRFEINDSDAAPVVREKWERGMAGVLGGGEDGTGDAHTVGAWLGFEMGDSPYLSGLRHDPQALRERGGRALARYVARLAEEAPVVVLLEDLHWSDDLSLALLDAAGTMLASSLVLVVATARPTLFDRHPHWGEGLSNHRRIWLEPLSKRESARLLAEILQRVDEVPAELTELVVSSAEGNPFYVEELVKWFVEQGVIRTSGDRWQVADDAVGSARVPPTLKGVLQARLDALPPEERALAQRASVVGRVFWDEAVARLSVEPDSPPASTSEALNRLRSREVVYQRERSSFANTREFLFKHAMLRDVAYDGVLRARRRQYHGLAAGWLEDTTERSGRADEYAGLIAEHHRQAGDQAAAARWYLRAGRQAAGVYANREALVLYGRALELAPIGDRLLRFDVLRAREGLFDRVGDRAAQRADLDAMAATLEDLDDPRRAVELRIAKARWDFEHSEYASGTVVAREGAEIASAAGLVELEAEAVLWTGKNLTWAFEHDEARRTLGLALELARAAGGSRVEGETLRYLAIVANNQSELGESVRLLEQAGAILRAARDEESESLVLGQLGAVYYNQGRYEDARVTLEQAREIIVRSGHRYRLAIMVSNLGSIAIEQGRLGMARRYCEDGLALQIELDDREGVGNSHAMLADVARLVGDDAGARHHADEVLADRGEIGFQVLAAAVLVTLTLIAARNGDASAAEAHAAESLEQARLAGSPLHEARTHLALGIARLQAADPIGAAASFEETIALAQRLDLPVVEREAVSGLAVALLERGQPREALAGLEPVLGDLTVAAVEGCLEPARLFAGCVRVLTATGDPRVDGVRACARLYLDETVRRIEDADLQEGFLHRVAINGELAELVGWRPDA